MIRHVSVYDAANGKQMRLCAYFLLCRICQPRARRTHAPSRDLSRYPKRGCEVRQETSDLSVRKKTPQHRGAGICYLSIQAAPYGLIACAVYVKPLRSRYWWDFHALREPSAPNRHWYCSIVHEECGLGVLTTLEASMRYWL